MSNIRRVAKAEKALLTNATKKTNADRIRNMSDEELAKFVTMVHGNGLLGTGPTNGWLDWLRQESEDKDGES